MSQTVVLRTEQNYRANQEKPVLFLKYHPVTTHFAELISRILVKKFDSICLLDWVI